MRTNGRLAVLVTVVAVTAVAVGGTLAYRQGPEVLGVSAAPLTASPTPSKPAAPTPSTTPVAVVTAPTPAAKIQVKVQLEKLVKGRDPQLPYVVGREVLGGGGWTTKIPGSQPIHQVGRVGNAVLAIVAKDTGGPGKELLRFDSGLAVKHTDNVTSLVTTEAGTAAYVAVPTDARGVPTSGGTVSFETSEMVPPQRLQLPAGDSLGLEVVAVANGNVYYRSQDGAGGPWQLFAWTPGEPTAKQVKSVDSPYRVSSDGAVLSSLSTGGGEQSCSTVSLLDSGKRLWKDCDQLVTGFSPDHSVTIGLAEYGANTPPRKIQVHDTATGKLIREWIGSFGTAVAEDDQHLLILAGVEKKGGDWSRSSIIRCEIATGTCETAVELTSAQLSLSGG